jgi:predicted dithiol-disulfide oxidoreductase (DUF899 family)
MSSALALACGIQATTKEATAVTDHKVGTSEEAQAARQELLEKEKELTRRGDELARQRRELPWVRIDEEYRFETDEGTKTLPELFDGRSQLFVYHFMFGPKYQAGCRTCSAGADTWSGAVPHLNARDVTLTAVSRAPLERLQAFQRQMGWTFPWASSSETDFNFDFGVSHTEEQLAQFLQGDVPPVIDQMATACGTDPAGYLEEGPGLSAFALSDGVVYHTYSSYARGLEIMLGFYPLLDRVPKGRDEEGETEFWLRRHDEYEDTRAGVTS